MAPWIVFHRYDYNYQRRKPPQQLATIFAQLNSFHEKNSGINQHVNENLSNLHLSEPYNGDDEAAVENSSGLHIAHTDKFTLHAPGSTLYLKRVLHYPQAPVDLLSIN